MVYIKMKLIWGPIVIGINDEAQIFGLWFEGQKHFPVISEEAQWLLVDEDNELKSGETLRDTHQLTVVIFEIIKQLREYEVGERQCFDLPLSPSGTEFQKRVWKILGEIPYGARQTYGDISHRIAKAMNKESMSAQAVGGALGHNPIAIIVPCHRVIGSKGGLTGYAGGIDKKEALLRFEDQQVMKNHTLIP